MPYKILCGDVYRMPSGRLARVEFVEGVRVTLSYIADPSSAADRMTPGDGVTLRTDFLASASGSRLPMQSPCRLVASGGQV